MSPPTKDLKVAQICSTSKCATDNLRVVLVEEDLDIVLIQEPWVSGSEVKGLPTSTHNILYKVAKVELPHKKNLWWPQATWHMRRQLHRRPSEDIVLAIMLMPGTQSERCGQMVKGEVLDITLINERSRISIDRWRVSNKRSFSDHNWILFSIGLHSTTERSIYRNPRRTNWFRYSTLRQKLGHVPRIEDSIDGLEEMEGRFNRIVSRACEVSCPITRARKASTMVELGASRLRRETRKAFNCSYRTKAWQTYRDKLKEYKKAITIAKRNSWESRDNRFCKACKDSGQRPI
ncbi:hypothetical protein EVAR_71049_1 [Eumeta japonica]|uniref:Endonuclease/exonuclease/phosphatase domain-containing protein n=1 Tax=Eumeta variegata TaxID=151549 RepID=A0A4C1T143_EUMVA|nr:hypothetical protein EVAR_71049_1 [Eumeta japonica]